MFSLLSLMLVEGTTVDLAVKPQIREPSESSPLSFIICCKPEKRLISPAYPDLQYTPPSPPPLPVLTTQHLQDLPSIVPQSPHSSC